MKVDLRVDPLSLRSHDRLPLLVQTRGAYIPENDPAIGDLTEMFDFGPVTR